MTKYIYFELNGRQYRTDDGASVEGKDGSTWNRTGSLPVVLAARRHFYIAQCAATTDEQEQRGSDVCYCGDYRSQHSRVRYGTEGPADRCFCGCVGFRWGRKANAEERKHWRKYHGKARHVEGRAK